jgi:hypothetical protein
VEREFWHVPKAGDYSEVRETGRDSLWVQELKAADSQQL